MSFHSLLFQ